MTPAVPDSFARTMVDIYQEEGRAWLEGLPALIAGCAERWGLTIGPPFADLSYHYVAPAVRADGAGVVLKLGVPNAQMRFAIAALQVYAGRHCVRLLDADPETGIQLLEQLRPGTLLSTLLDDAKATSAAAEVMRGLWQPLPEGHPFPTVAGWAAALGRLRAHYGGGTGPLPSELFATAEGLFAELLPSSAPAVLLHGDLHHFNILAADRAPWLAIDPQGVAGEPAYEVGALLRNPWPGLLAMPDAARVTARRVDQLAEELGF
ncbi:MAG TPA: aminoglycoside phosphotransferase family protein, partial [Chloroflexia bacterium]|nr:aminoglycoside phosphotransferase family protein [Chloroflexia bacterium]